jgi:hypothetical protein
MLALKYHQIVTRLEEIEIELLSLEGDDEYDLDKLYEEKETLENLLANGEYSDFNNYE